MEKLSRWIAKRNIWITRIGAFVLCVLVIWGQLVWDWPVFLGLLLYFGGYYLLALLVGSRADSLLRAPLKVLKEQCDPYPFLEEVREQQCYPGTEALKQMRTIDYAMVLRSIGEYDQAFALLSTTNIDKYAGTQPAVKAIYYNNLMDLCMLMGKHQEAVIWYDKLLLIFHDMKPGKQKDRLHHLVDTNRAMYHFCKGEWEQALQALGTAKIENLNDRIENAMMYARVYLALGETEKAIKPLQFVAENGNKLYFVTEAKELLAKINMEEQ